MAILWPICPQPLLKKLNNSNTLVGPPTPHAVSSTRSQLANPWMTSCQSAQILPRVTETIIPWPWTTELWGLNKSGHIAILVHKGAEGNQSTISWREAEKRCCVASVVKKHKKPGPILLETGEMLSLLEDARFQRAQSLSSFHSCISESAPQNPKYALFTSISPCGFSYFKTEYTLGWNTYFRPKAHWHSWLAACFLPVFSGLAT